MICASETSLARISKAWIKEHRTLVQIRLPRTRRRLYSADDGLVVPTHDQRMSPLAPFLICDHMRMYSNIMDLGTMSIRERPMKRRGN